MSEIKDSGIYWLGEVASNWDLVPAWALFTEGKDKCSSNDPHLVPSRVFGVVTRERLVELTGNKPVDNEASAHNMKHVDPNDFIISMGSHETGIEHSRLTGKVSNDYRVLRPTEKANPEFYKWFLKSDPLIEGLRGLTTEIRVGQRIHYSRFSLLRLPLPPLDEQQRIADYLDRETAEIDAAVADLDRYVELLEKRRLLAVDEVINSEDVSATKWPRMALKLVIKSRFVGDWGGDPGTSEVDLPCVRVADFDRQTNTVGDDVPTIRSYALDKYEMKRLRHHDILIERSGGGAKTPVGSAMLYTGGGEALCANFIEVLRLNEDQHPEFWVHLLRREYMGKTTMQFVKQTTGIQNLDPQGFYDQKFHVPSLTEQRSLASELNDRTVEIDVLIAESTKLRDLLLKRRSVLITEVVTGRKQV